MSKLTLVVAILVSPVAAAAQDSLRYADPSADRAIVVTTARQLPAGDITLTGHFFGLIPAITYGVGGWSTLTVGTALLALPVGFLAYGSIKVRVVETSFFAAAVGDFFATVSFDEGSVAGHWPFAVVTVGREHLSVTGALGLQLGGLRLDGRSVDAQLAASARIGRGARLIAELHDLGRDERLVILAVRVWGAPRYFVELGGTRFSRGPGQRYRFGPWVSVGLRLQ